MYNIGSNLLENLNRTDVLGRGDGWTRVLAGTHQPIQNSSADKILVLAISDVGDSYVIVNGTLSQHFLLDASSCRTTTAPTNIRIVLPNRISNRPTVPEASFGDQTPAQEAIAEIRDLSKLTNEEIAPLAGVSRRSLQAWVAGERISARKDQRLRDLLSAIRAISTENPRLTRQRLLSRTPGGIRPYDMLREERFDDAVDSALGRRTQNRGYSKGVNHSLLSQIDQIEISQPQSEGRLIRRLSGRLRK